MTPQFNFTHSKLVKNLIREPFAWPGGYEKFAITSDGEYLCHQCVKKEFKTILHSTLFSYSDGWQVAALEAECNTDSETICSHCYRVITENFTG